MAISAGLGLGGSRPGVCTSSTRPSSPYEGMMIYETDTDLTYLYNGSSWQQVSGGTAVGNSGLVYITSATATSGTLLALDNVFTSLYDNYLIILEGWSCTTGASGISMQLRSGGTASTTGYYYTASYANYTASPSMSMYGASNGASIDIGSVADTTSYGSAILNVVAPKLTRNTNFNNQGADQRTGGSGNRYMSGTHTVASSYDGIHFSIAYTITNAKATVYGYRK